jgi:hypothetical protein
MNLPLQHKALVNPALARLPAACPVDPAFSEPLLKFKNRPKHWILMGFCRVPDRTRFQTALFFGDAEDTT